MKFSTRRLASGPDEFFATFIVPLIASARLIPLALVLAFAAAAPVLLQAQATYVFGKATLPANGAGTSLLQGDFNGDGTADFVWANSSTNTVSVILSLPHGAYAPKVDYVAAASGSLVGVVIVADFNNDGKMDLAVANNDGFTSFLYGNGDGTFQPRVAQAIPQVGHAAGLATGDFNRDSNADLVVASSLGTYVYLGDGKGNFTLDANVPTGILSVSAAVADFNNDGFADIMIGDLAGYGVMWLGDGNGGFQTAPNTPGAVPGAIADFNGDGVPDDFYTVKSCGRYTCHYSLYEYFGNGDGTFTRQTISLSSYGIAVAADFNQDGKMDLLLVPGGILFGNGDGTFTSPSPVPQGNPTREVVGDFNHDGQLDIAELDKGGFLTVTLGNHGNFAFPSTATVPTTTRPAHAGFGDFNNDGKPDQLTVDGSIQVQFGNGDGTFQSPISSPIANTGIGGTVLGDFNKDGNLDLVVLTNQTSIVEFYLYLGNGNGTFQAGVPVSANSRWPLSGVAGDFNGDGNLDVAISAQNGNGVDVFLGSGNGSFVPATTYPTCFAGFTGGTAAYDFNGDGKLDIAVVCDDFQGGMNVLLGNGDGTLKPAVVYHAGTDYDASIALGDFNDDGKVDVAISGFTGVTTFLGNGDGTFQAGIPTSTCAVTWLVASDFNLDGKTDLGCVYDGNGATQMGLLFSNGDGKYLPSFLPVPHSTDPGPTAVDLNGDGVLDIVSSAPAPTSLTTYYLPNLPVAFLLPAQLSFANQAVGTTSAPLQLTLANPGAAPLSVGSVTVTGDFAVGNDGCGGTTVAVAASCVIDVTFTPTASGPRTGTVVIASNNVGGTAVLPLSGQGEGGAPAIDLSPSSLTFAPQIIKKPSKAQTISLTNSGDASLTISGIAIAGPNPSDYSQTNDCGTSLPVSATCSITVVFKPAGLDTRTAAVTITDNAPGSPQAVPLSGVGTQVKITPTALKFGNVVVNSSSTKTVIFANQGATAVHISGISISGGNAGDFSVTSGCGSTVAAKSTCTVALTFTPSAKGVRSATLAFSDDGGGSPQAVPLTGTGK